ncbi:MAG: Ig-like domain-containing protein [Myxococcota bacterium]|nr:Ig-like domain-containing protein [Myxococcota bacterium]
MRSGCVRPLILGLALLLSGPLAAGAVVDVSASKTDELVVDVNGDGQVNAGDTIRYRITIRNAGDMDALDAALADTIDANTTLVPGSVNVSPIAYDDAYSAIGNTERMVVDAADGLLANDVDPDDGPDPLRVVDVDDSVTQGTVSVEPDGSFDYDPPAGVTGINDTFAYTVSDGRATSSATVTVSVQNLVWYVDDTAAPGGDGRLTAPFDTLAEAEAAAGPGDTIFVFEGSGSGYAAGITLQDGQALLGQGEPFELVLDGETVEIVPAAGRPTISRPAGPVIRLARNNQVRGLSVSAGAGAGVSGTSAGSVVIRTVDVSATGGPALLLSASTLAVSLDALSSTNSVGAGLDLSSNSGSFEVSGVSTVRAPSGDGLRLAGNLANFRFATIDVETNGSRGLYAVDTGGLEIGGGSLETANAVGLEVTSTALDLALDQVTVNHPSGGGIRLASNSGSTRLQGLDLVTSASGLHATSAGALTVTGAGNRITTTSGTAVEIVSTGIGPSGVTFESVSASGGSNGIVLRDTGAGPFAVTGAGGVAGSGGTIEGHSGDGVRITNAANVSLAAMEIRNNADSGIDASAANGLVLDGCTLSDNTNAVGEAGLQLSNLTGSALGGANPTRIVNTTVRGSTEHNVELVNTSGVLTELLVSNSSFADTSAALGADGFLVETRGTARATLRVEDSSFADNQTQGFQGNAVDSSALDVTITGSLFVSNNEGVVLSVGGGADLDFDVSGNPGFTDHGGNAVSVVTSTNANGGARIDGTIADNTVDGSDFGDGVLVLVSGDARGAVAVTGNTVTGIDFGRGIFVQNGELDGDTAQLDVTVSGNSVTVDPTNASHGILVQSRKNAALCANVQGNAANAGAFSFGIRVRQRDASSFELERLTPGSVASEPVVIAHVGGENPGAASVDATISTSFTGVADGACETP